MRPPLFAGAFFEDQESVDPFVSSYDAGSHTPDKVQSYQGASLLV